MAFRRKISKRKSKRSFRKGAKVRKKNVSRKQMRGGYRL